MYIFVGYILMSKRVINVRIYLFYFIEPQDGKRSSQFEHTLLVTETGVDILTARKGGQPHFMDNF